ncbi:SGNH/GDSL hydrolase family protein [Nocardioides marmorisolisilvae]|uniref:SGNH/GDSL hydrolase family protein n=1 Tax=Nocardioides marmorisolisilvae TaxID=1542737 RepID=A0A3N0DZD8_9ACTN|nr:SGNH/GDSL hydrolase family protein [Nocardioides marmorisolisilvae]RNL80921.1 SGNH/GDSL hydrolase family protein [Nocardioides marmorisolisilvae]
MGKAAAARKLASAAVFGGGGLSVLGAALYGVLRAEATVARRVIGKFEGRVPDATGWYGRGRPGPAIKVALLGDSSAAGYGVSLVEETPGAHLGSGIAARANRRVHLDAFCFTGAKSSDLVGQVKAALPTEPDLAVILIGANDVTHRMLPSESVRYLSEAVHRLREHGVEVVVGTCPDLGTIRPIPQPLRFVARTWSRRLAAAQAIATVEAGGRSLSLGSILGPEFDAAPALFFGPDRFHPSAAGYASLATVLVPTALAALGHGPEDETHPRVTRGEGLRSIGKAAVHASKNPGTEIDGTEIAGSTRGPGGRWVLQMRRRWLNPVNAEAPESEEDSSASEEVPTS